MSLIKKPGDQVQITNIRALIYGQPGIRKTSWALTAPDPILFDFDNGIHRLDPIYRRDAIPMDSWRTAELALSEDLSAYKTIVIDTAGKALDLLMIEVMNESPKNKAGSSLSMMGWGVLKNRFNIWKKRVEALGKHLVFIAHDKEGTAGDGETKTVRPDVPGGSLALLVRDMDLVGYMESKNNKPTINFSASDKAWGKNSAGVMDFVDVGTMQLSEVFDLYQKRQDSQADLRSKYDLVISELTSVIEGVNDEETARSATKIIQETEHIWGSKQVAQLLFIEQLKKVNLKYSKLTDKYETIPVQSDSAK